MEIYFPIQVWSALECALSDIRTSVSATPTSGPGNAHIRLHPFSLRVYKMPPVRRSMSQTYEHFRLHAHARHDFRTQSCCPIPVPHSSRRGGITCTQNATSSTHPRSTNLRVGHSTSVFRGSVPSRHLHPRILQNHHHTRSRTCSEPRPFSNAGV